MTLSSSSPSETILAQETLGALAAFWESLQPVDRLIAKDRIFSPEPLTLEKIGQRAGLTRERIRQRQKSIEKQVQHLSSYGAAGGYWMTPLAASLRSHLGPVVKETDLEARVSEVFPVRNDPGTDNSVPEVARSALRKELGYHCRGGVCLDQAALAVVERLKEAAPYVEDDTGLIDELELRSRLSDETWHQHWDVLIEQCGLYRLTGCLAQRDTGRARAKAALLSIGRPATKEEVGMLCGLEPARAGAQLSAITGVVRADKNRWGLSQWVEDSYDGISPEIVQRIEEDGGATRLTRLLEEIPRMFGVSESSVRAFVGTPKFALLDGYVSVADISSIALRPLSDIVHGNTDDGRPYWRFRVEERYLNGYSLSGLPAEIVRSLGCQPDGRMRVPISTPAYCQPISASWPLDSTAGASIGYLAEPLRRLGACTGDLALLVIDAPSSVSLTIETPLIRNREPTRVGVDEGSERARDLLNRIKNRRRGL